MLTQTREVMALNQAVFPGSLLELDQVVLDAVPVGIYACDAHGLIRRFNRAAADLWGRAPRVLDPAQRFCGSFRVESLDGKPIPPDQTPMARALRDGEPVRNAEAVVLNPDGRRWIARVNIDVLRDAGGSVTGAVNCFQDITREHEAHRDAERTQRTFNLAMTASKMGTWRYTLADNICIYDEQAQRLYGLTEARFLHDDDGVKAKFHPDDMPLMWQRVAKALDAAGDGRYEVEYRVKQLDGSWRWLSAWGLVEHEGEGDARKAVAIAGASRDLTEEKKADELQKMLLAELDHRVKNTLTIVQSLAFHTLRGAPDLKTAQKALDGRIFALAQAHDLLTHHKGVGANLGDVIARAIQPFRQGQIDLSGPSVYISAKVALAFSLALHELGTNATKYGALSSADGRVRMHWQIVDGSLRFSWQEMGGPEVTPPTRKGFGSRLLEAGLLRELDGETKMSFGAAGVRCDISARYEQRIEAVAAAAE